MQDESNGARHMQKSEGIKSVLLNDAKGRLRLRPIGGQAVLRSLSQPQCLCDYDWWYTSGKYGKPLRHN